jgi:hypothetical protein
MVFGKKYVSKSAPLIWHALNAECPTIMAGDSAADHIGFDWPQKADRGLRF